MENMIFVLMEISKMIVMLSFIFGFLLLVMICKEKRNEKR